MGAPAQLLAFAPPSETALLDFVRGQASDTIIRAIASNDREHEIAKYEFDIRRQLAPDPPLGFAPWQAVGEVLELERNKEPIDFAGQTRQLLACALLLRNVAYVGGVSDEDGAYFVETSAYTVLQLVRSAIALGSEAAKLALGFLLWLHGTQRNPTLYPFFSFGALLLQAYEDPSSTNLRETCRWVEEDEKRGREQSDDDDVHSDRWLTGLNYQEDSHDSPQLWANTLAQIISTKRDRFPSDVASTLAGMHERLSR